MPLPARLHTLLMIPVHLLAVGTQAKSFKANPVIGSRVLNRLGLHVLRLVIAHGVARLRWVILSPFATRAERRAFHDTGYLIVRDVLDADQLAALKAEAAALTEPVYECIQGDTLTHRQFIDRATERRHPALTQALRNRTYQRLMRYAAARNTSPFFHLQRIRNGSTSGGADPQKKLHSDTFHPTLKTWLFLEDVPIGGGPFTYVPGSNRLTWKRLKWEYGKSITALDAPDGYTEKGSRRAHAADLEALDLPPEKSFAVAANTLVIANTFGFHRRGDASGPCTRTELWGYERSNPFNPWPGLGFMPWHDLKRLIYRWWLAENDQRHRRRGGQASWHRIAPETNQDVVAPAD